MFGEIAPARVRQMDVMLLTLLLSCSLATSLPPHIFALPQPLLSALSTAANVEFRAMNKSKGAGTTGTRAEEVPEVSFGESMYVCVHSKALVCSSSS